MADAQLREIGGDGRGLVESEAGAKLDTVRRERDLRHARQGCKRRAYSTRTPSLQARDWKRSTHSAASSSPDSSLINGYTVSSIS